MAAFAAIKPSNRPLLLVIAGEGPARNELEAAAARLNLGDRCRLIGLQSDMPLVHHTLDLLVQSSESEGTPNVVLEAMAFETPIVATDVGGTSELVRSEVDGLLVRPGEADVLTAAMERVILRPDEAKRRAASARARVETHLSFDARLHRIETIYDELVAASRRAAGVVEQR